MVSALLWTEPVYVAVVQSMTKSLQRKSNNISCITQYPDFDAAILNCLTIETVYHQFKQKVKERGWELQEKLSEKKNRQV